MAGLMLGVHRGSPTVMIGAMAGMAFLGVVGDVNGPKLISDPERMADKWFGLRK